jgi:hypothetical protein
MRYEPGMRILGLTLIALLSSSGLLGCAGVSPYARATAGHVGCSAESIAISHEEDEGGGPRSWVAACGGTKYACSSNGDPGGAHAKVVCSEIGARRDHDHGGHEHGDPEHAHGEPGHEHDHD